MIVLNHQLCIKIYEIPSNDCPCPPLNSRRYAALNIQVKTKRKEKFFEQLTVVLIKIHELVFLNIFCNL